MEILTVLKIHYFIYWGSISAILNFNVLFAMKHTYVSESETGILFCILPLALIFAKPIFCYIADQYTVHEYVLVFSILGTTISYGLLVIIPYLKVQSLLWPLFCIFMFFGAISAGVLTSITDSLVLKLAEKQGSNFGQIRVWGTLGWGLMSYVIGAINSINSKIIPSYLPGIIFFIVLEIIDLLLMIKSVKKLKTSSDDKALSNKNFEDHNDKLNSFSETFNENDENRKKFLAKYNQERKKIIKYLLLTFYKHPMILKNIVICSIVGILTALHWVYFPLYLNNLVRNDTKLIGLASVVQCFCGEVPFMYFASSIVEFIGSDASLNLVLLTFSFRYLAYTFFISSNAYFILFVEISHGITFGLFYYVMNIIAGQYSKKMSNVQWDYILSNYDNEDENDNKEIVTNKQDCNCYTIEENIYQDDSSAFATMQSVMSASYEGFGVAMGSLIAGYMIQNYGFKFFWTIASLLAFVIFILDLIIILGNKLKLYIKNKLVDQS